MMMLLTLLMMTVLPRIQGLTGKLLQLGHKGVSTVDGGWMGAALKAGMKMDNAEEKNVDSAREAGAGEACDCALQNVDMDLN